MSDRQYDYLATATDAEGVRYTHHVTASSAVEAMARLEAGGCTDIELHTDDAAAAATPLTALDSDEITPADLVEARSLTRVGHFFFVLRKQLRAAGVAYAAAIAFVGWTLYQGAPRDFFFWGACFLAVLPLVLSFHAAFLSASRQFDRMIEAWAWGRWESVLALAPKLRGKGVPDFELDAREAVALAKLGRVEEGLARLEQYADGDEVPYWMYLGRVGEFYEVIEDHERSVGLMRQAFEDAPDNPTVVLDYAMSLLKNEVNLDEATRLLESVQEMPLSDLLELILPYLLGLRDLNAGNPTAARAHFEEVRLNVRPIAAGQPLFALMLDTNAAYYAIACAFSGDSDAAATLAKQARPRLEALGMTRLLGRLSDAGI